MNKEQILALAEKADETATQYLQCAGEYHPDYHSVRDEHFYHAAISAYKAELLKEVGEPVLYTEFAEDGGWLGDTSEYADHLEEPHALFTSDQVAAAILKATKSLEKDVERLKSALTQFLDQEGNPPSDTGEWRYVLQVLGESK